MSVPKAQIAVVQSKESPTKSGLPLAVTSSKRLPDLSSPHHVLIRVLAVGLNPTDYKMITHFYMEGTTVGCDFSGIIEEAGSSSVLRIGDRICGADFPYRPDNPSNGAFQQYVVADSRHVIRMPEDWSDTQAAALGAIGWGTSCLSISDPEALDLKGLPSKPVEKPLPVLVYGGATATGIMAIQMLKRSGYAPIAVCSTKSAPLVQKCGAIGTASYTSADCVEQIKSIANGVPIKHALDCITDAESASVCYNVLARVGGRYACLEDCPKAWRPRRSVKVKVVMGFEGQGYDVDLGHPTYARKANWELHSVAARWAKEMQSLVDNKLVTTQPIREIEGGFPGIIKALEMLQAGEIRGEKLVIKVGV